jgi:hypothetical protein
LGEGRIVSNGINNFIQRWEERRGTEEEAGRGWYDYAAGEVRGISSDHHLAAAVTAVLSPSVRWEKNLAQARELLETGQIIRYGGFKRNLMKACLMLNAKDPFEFLTGPKVRAFGFGLWLGNASPFPVIDSHMTNIWDGKIQGSNRARSLKPKGYGEVAAGLIQAAERVGLNVMAFQATTWLVQKRLVSGR